MPVDQTTFLQYGPLGALALLFILYSWKITFSVLPKKEKDFRLDMTQARTEFLNQLGMERAAFVGELKEQRKSWVEAMKDLTAKITSLEASIEQLQAHVRR